METVFYKECFLLNIYHYEALKCLEKLKVGTDLMVSKPKETESFSNDVVILQYESQSIGELSKEDSKLILDFLNLGWNSNDNNRLFSATICNINNEGNENTKIRVVVKILKPKN